MSEAKETLSQKRDRIAKEFYGKKYVQCCWMQQNAINARINGEKMQSGKSE